jgi:DNA repair protein RadC
MCVKPFVKSDKPGVFYVVDVVTEKDIMAMAVKLVKRRFQRGRKLTSPTDTKDYLTVKMHEFEHEVFGAIFLDTQHSILSFDLLFRGTIDSSSVHPREVVKQALRYNAAAVIFAHNHPSGVAEPSRADEMITRRLVEALAMIDVRVLDHFVVGGTEVVSFAERGLM